MTKREFLDTVFALAPNEANAIMDAFDEYVESNVVPTGRSGKERRMTKYIIELDDRIKLVTSVGVTENGVVYTTSDYVHNLEELNSDYINEHFGELQDEAYKRGLEDAWEAAQKVVCKTEVGGMSLDTLQEVFGVLSPAAIMQSNTAQQAIDKIKAYEDGKKSVSDPDRIEVGDEVKAPFGTAVVVCCDYDADKASYIYSSGRHGFDNTWNLKKTGKHYDIQSILEAMRE